MTVQEAEAAYDRAKRAYRSAGKAALGKPAGAVEQRAYEERKREYHRAGEELRRARRAAR
jgi:hypothetical protein